MKMTRLFTFSFALGLAVPAMARQSLFGWAPASDESVRLDPANYHAGRTYRPGPQGGNIHVQIDAKQPVTVGLAYLDDWNYAMQHPEKPEALLNMEYRCHQEHVLKVTYSCDRPADPVILILRDDRNPDRALFAGLGTILTGHGTVKRRFVAPNDVHIRYYQWTCVRSCVEPQYQWVREVKEKYQLASLVKIYGGFIPERDGQQVSVKIKSPVPMVVSVLPSQVAGELYAKPDALEKNSCQQRNVEFQCTLHVSDGPQSLVVRPESLESVPHKKAEIEILAVRCVANCAMPKDK